jgi:hypothetical protein
VVTGLAAIAAWIAALLYARLDPFDLHVITRHAPALIVLPLAMAAAWAWAAEARFRRATVAWLVIAAIAATMSTTAWVDGIVRDPLRVREPALRVSRARLVALARSEVNLSASELWLSPTGRSFAVAPEPEEEDEEPIDFTIGTTGGAQHIVQAYAVRFADDETIVTVERARDGVAVRTHPVGAPGETPWTVSVAGDPWGTLTVDPVSRRWRLDQPRSAGVRIVSGTIGSDVVDDRVVGNGDPRAGYVQWLGTDAEPLGVVYDYAPPTTLQTVMRGMLDLPWRMPLALRFPRGGMVRSHFDGTCYQGGPGLAVACVVKDGTRSHVWTWDGRDWRASVSLDGEYAVHGRDASGWLAGWQRGRLTLVQPTDGRGLAIGDTCGRGECLTAATYTGQALGGLLTSAGHVSVATYRVEPITPRSP